MNEKKNPFLWDGSDLGNILDENIKAITEVDDVTYWKISLNEQEEICIVRRISTTCPCLIDELKLIFGLPKLGTHRVTYQNKLLLLIKATVNKEGCIEKEITLDNFSLPHILNNNTFISRVQELLVFRDLLGISKSYEKSIIIRWRYDSSESAYRPYPVSFYEPGMKPFIKNRIIPKNISDKWFSKNDSDISSVTRRLLNVSKVEDIPDAIYNLRINIEKTIERVDRTLIFYVTFILDRISHHIMLSLATTCTNK